MLEVKKNPEQDEHQLYFNGKLIPEVFVWENKIKSLDRQFSFSIKNNDFSKYLLELEPKIFLGFHEIRIADIFSWIDSNFFESFVEIYVFEENNILGLELDFQIQPKSGDWSLPFSINSYTSKLVDICEESKLNCLYNIDAEPYDVYLTISNHINKLQSSIKNEIENLSKEIEKFHNKTIQILVNESNNSVLISFVFPESIRNICEQYLVYFATFLNDLGINATSTLKEEVGKVLFSVTPTDENQALDKIREALAVYLDLPNSPITDIEYSENFALMRLQQQVRNLQHSQQMAKTELLSSQYALRLAQQNIDNQDQLLIHQNSTIENQNRIIEKIMSKSIMMDSLENKEELEEICEGLKIGKSKFLKEQLGIDLNPATFAKGIGKKILGKPENTSIIETDEEK